MRQALDATGILRHVRFHDLRHNAASHKVMAGADLRTVGAILGHKDPKIPQRYAHLAPDHLKDAIDPLDCSETGQRESSEKNLS
tara:strand:- start:157 stop:408 length:252 start_codon:yes stop_codon:yes gene_type:complete